MNSKLIQDGEFKTELKEKNKMITGGANQLDIQMGIIQTRSEDDCSRKIKRTEVSGETEGASSA